MKFLKIVLISIVALCFFSCTNHSEQTSSDTKDMQSPSSVGSRAPASTKKAGRQFARKKLKKIKFKRKGFYIPYKYIARLPYERRMVYYNIFTHAAVAWKNKLIYKSGAQLDSVPFNLEELFIEKAYAEVCPSAMSMYDHGVRCTFDNSQYPIDDPRVRRDLERYGAVPEILDHSLKKCAETDQTVCPVIGMEIEGKLARQICTRTGRTPSGKEVKYASDLCAQDLRSRGYKNVNKMLDACDRGGEVALDEIVSNISCENLEESIRKYILMEEERCKGNNGSICTNIREGLKAIDIEVSNPEPSPETPIALPDHPSCDAIAEEHGMAGGEVEMSEHWRALMTLARRNCRGLSGKDEHQLANQIYGRCDDGFTPNVVGNGPRDINKVVAEYQNWKMNRNTSYEASFVQTFGMTPGAFESFFCVPDGNTFYHNAALEEPRSKIIKGAVDELYSIVDLGEHRDNAGNFRSIPEIGTTLATQQRRFDALRGRSEAGNGVQGWLEYNDNLLKTLAKKGGTTAESVMSSIPPNKVAKYKGYIQSALANRMAHPDGKKLDALVDFGDEAQDSFKMLQNRAAMAKAMREILDSPAHRENAQAAGTWLNNCLTKVSRKTETWTQDGNKAVPNLNYSGNTEGCRYIKVTNVAAYATNYGMDDRLVVYDETYVNEPPGSPRGACLEHTGDFKEVFSSGAVQITAENPLTPGVSPRTFDLTSDEWEGEKPSRRQYQLYRQVGCNQDNPKVGPGVDTSR